MKESIYYTTAASPIGKLTLTGRDDALTGLFVERDGVDGHPDATPFTNALDQLESYWAGEPTTFDLPVDLKGTPFQVKVWNALRDIPYGETISYRTLAERIGNPKAYRAVGAANGKNPISIIVPCHRVIGSGGALVGYGWGIERKKRLLDLEQGVR